MHVLTNLVEVELSVGITDGPVGPGPGFVEDDEEDCVVVLAVVDCVVDPDNGNCISDGMQPGLNDESFSRTNLTWKFQYRS